MIPRTARIWPYAASPHEVLSYVGAETGLLIQIIFILMQIKRYNCLFNRHLILGWTSFKRWWWFEEKRGLINLSLFKIWTCIIIITEGICTIVYNTIQASRIKSSSSGCLQNILTNSTWLQMKWLKTTWVLNSSIYIIYIYIRSTV